MGLCDRCSVGVIAFTRYFECNIPIEYFSLKMPDTLHGDPKDFHGSKDLLQVYLQAIDNLNDFYVNGTSMCLAGANGIGKTMCATNILKKASHKNYTCLYTTLCDSNAALTLPSNEAKFGARQELMCVDFLVIDEVDPKYIATENAADFFGRSFEHIIRTRLQNKLPTILCSNSPNPLEMFNGMLKQSLESLMNKIPLIPIMGQDYRKLSK